MREREGRPVPGCDPAGETADETGRGVPEMVPDEARRQRLESLRRAIAAGEYAVSAEALAERLIETMERRR